MKIRERLALMDWKRVRHVSMSVDREKFIDGREAHRLINDGRLIPQLIHNLKRTAGILISDWLWVLEWHSDGFPHYHLFIEVDKEGRAGMIGGDLLRKYWPWALWLKEWYVGSEDHWKALSGYFGKHGYFGSVKGVQGILPEWALYSTPRIRIRRFGASTLPGVDGEIRDSRIKLSFGFHKKTCERRNYFAIISTCGDRSQVSISNHLLNITRIVDVPSYVFRDNFKGDWIEGMGYLCVMDEFELFALSEKHSGLLPLVDEILDSIERYDGFNGWVGESTESEKLECPRRCLFS